MKFETGQLVFVDVEEGVRHRARRRGIVVGPCAIRNGWMDVYWFDWRKTASYPKSCIKPLSTINPQEDESDA